jgi:hypothetical protein
MNYNAPGLGGPPDSDEQFLELVADYMSAGMSQDDAEVAAAEKMDAFKEARDYERGEDAWMARQDGDY